MMENLSILKAETQDAEALVQLRISAMRPSLEAIGRFDPSRSRERFLSTFCCETTWKLLCNATLVGFYAYQLRDRVMFLDHLYIDPEFQSQGIASSVITQLKSNAVQGRLSIRLLALKESRSNQFYKKHGFQLIDQLEFDNIYEWSVDENTKAGD